MEDIKKIQEFFSAPLEENEKFDHVARAEYGKPWILLSIAQKQELLSYMNRETEKQFQTDYEKRRRETSDYMNEEFKKGDKVTYLGNPAEITFVGKDQMDRTYYSVSYDKGKGKTKASNLYNKGGEIKAVKEDMNDPVLVKMRADKVKMDKFEKDQEQKIQIAKRGGAKEEPLRKLANMGKIAFLEKEREQLMRDMEQEAEPEGGPIADEYGSKLNRIDAAIAKLSGRKEMTYDQAIAENDSYVRVSKPRFIKDKNHPNFLNVYMDYDIGPGGASIALGKETMSGQIRRLSSAEAVRQMNDIAKKLNDNFNVEDIEVTDLENGKVRIFAVSDDFIDMNPNTLNEYDVHMPSQEKVDKFFALTQNEMHYLASKPVMGQEGTFNLMPIEPWDEYDYSNWMALVRKAKQQGKSIDEASKGAKNYFEDLKFNYQKAFRYLESDEKKEYQRLAKNYFSSLKESLNENNLLRQTNLSSEEYQKAKKLKDFNKDNYKWNPDESLYVKLNESIAQTLAETIKLGEGVIEEELCPKGKAYIKRRKAAGEKSSAYLSGRAVKVCKGQMSGRKKKK